MLYKIMYHLKRLPVDELFFHEHFYTYESKLNNQLQFPKVWNINQPVGLTKGLFLIYGAFKSGVNT